MHDLLLAIDQGTTGTTCLVVDPSLRILTRASTEFPQHFPRPGWVEHDPEDIWASVASTITQVTDHPDVRGRPIGAIGITNQRETVLAWDRNTGAPIHRAIVWQDRRTADRCRSLRETPNAARVRDVSGLVIDPYFSATKIEWLLDHVEGARGRAETGELAVGTIDTYLLWRLTGGTVHATEPSNACRTLLWPLRGGGWDPELCDTFGVPLAALPRVLASNACFGTTRGVPALPDGIPIHGIAGDQQAALFGQACFEPGQAKCTYGTGAFVVVNTGAQPVPSSHGLLTSVAWQLGEDTTYCLEGSSFMAGAVVQWLRDQLGFIERAADIEALAATVDTSEGVVVVPAHAGLGAPHWRPDARGTIRGLTRGSHKGHIARAALEGIAMQIADLVAAMDADTGRAMEILRVDGGAAANDLLMQIQCDLLDIRLERPASVETTALGAATLAGLGSGRWPDLDTLRASWRCERRFEPSGPRSSYDELRSAWRDAIASLSPN